MNLGEQCERTPTAGPWGLFFIILILYNHAASVMYRSNCGYTTKHCYNSLITTLMLLDFRVGKSTVDRDSILAIV